MFQGILHEEPSIWYFLLVTCVMGGWAAWMTGRALASTWRSTLQLFGYLLILGAAVRFIHFALFDGTLLTAHYYLVDTVVVQIVGALGYRKTRARQMADKYRWLYLSDGPFFWKERV